MKLIINDKWIGVDDAMESENSVHIYIHDITVNNIEWIAKMMTEKEIYFAILMYPNSVIFGEGVVNSYNVVPCDQSRFKACTVEIRRCQPTIDAKKEKMAYEAQLAAGFTKNPIEEFIGVERPVIRKYFNDRLITALEYINERLNHEKT